MTTFILVPGAGGDAFYWHLVLPLLRDAGHEAVAVTLPAGEDGAGLAVYADTIARAMGDRSDVVLVAQSMGAFSAPIAAARGGVSRIALVAPMIPVPGETPGSSGALRARTRPHARSPSPRAATPTRRSTCTRCSSTTSPPDVAERLLAQGEGGDEAASWDDPWPLDAWPDIPTTVIAGARDRLFPLPYMRALARDRLGIEDVAVVDSGHLPALSRPEELARAILAG